MIAMEPQDFNEALLLMLRRGHRVEVALVEARRAYPALYENYCRNLPGNRSPDRFRPDEAVASAARKLAGAEGIALDVAIERILRDRPDLAGPYWQSFTTRT
jgi:hypothetical protein